MKLKGFRKVEGENSNGKYAFYELYIEGENAMVSREKGGSIPYVRYSRNRGNRFPCVSVENFNDCVADGLKIDSEIIIGRDDKFRTIMNVVK